MPKKVLCENETGNVTTPAISLTSSQAEVVIAGTLGGASITFEDNKYEYGWAPVLNSEDGSVTTITEATNELQLISATNTGRSLRATIAGGSGASITIVVDEGI